MIQKTIGSFITHDAAKKAVLLAWEMIHGSQTAILNDKIQSISDVLVQSYAQTETNFVYKRPDLVPADFMLKSLVDKVSLEHIHQLDRSSIEHEIGNILEHFFRTTNWAAYASPQDTYIFVTAHDAQTNTPLGVMQFWLSPKFGPNSAKSALSGVIPQAEHRGLEALLMSSILAINPEIDRIFLHTRSTNSELIKLYCALGFAECPETLPHWTNLEYRVECSTMLQELSKTMIRK